MSNARLLLVAVAAASALAAFVGVCWDASPVISTPSASTSDDQQGALDGELEVVFPRSVPLLTMEELTSAEYQRMLREESSRQAERLDEAYRTYRDPRLPTGQAVYRSLIVLREEVAHSSHPLFFCPVGIDSATARIRRIGPEGEPYLREAMAKSEFRGIRDRIQELLAQAEARKQRETR
ncbi:MAG: hypothetical protein KY476_10295 [Planctomycetes bacterium]|nr:hypothetical protein [Planctomycetota bacterium]